MRDRRRCSNCVHFYAPLVRSYFLRRGVCKLHKEEKHPASVCRDWKGKEGVKTKKEVSHESA